LPAQPYDLAQVVYRHVSAEGLLAWQGQQYSVPWRLMGRLLAVRITAEELVVYGPNLEEVARHRLLPARPQGQKSVQPEQQPPPKERLRRAALEERFAEFGPLGPRFLAGLVQEQRCGWEQARRLLELLTVYRRSDVQAALERAVHFGAFGLSAIQRILAATARPKPVLEVLAEEERRRLEPLLRDNPVGPRPLREYQHLWQQETGDGQATTSAGGAADQPAPANDGPPPASAGGSSRTED
jgi:hypothetical protein